MKYVFGFLASLFVIAILLQLVVSIVMAVAGLMDTMAQASTGVNIAFVCTIAGAIIVAIVVVLKCSGPSDNDYGSNY